MSKNKTIETNSSVADFVAALNDETQRIDSQMLIKIMEAQTGMPAKMWGPAIIGFGSYHYKYESGRAGDMALVSFSPRTSAISLYIGLSPERKEELLQNFGKYKMGKGCIYVKRLAEINVEVLKQMIGEGIKYMQDKYGK